MLNPQFRPSVQYLITNVFFFFINWYKSKPFSFKKNVFRILKKHYNQIKGFMLF